MTLGEILDTAFKVFRNNFFSLFLIGVVVQVLSFATFFMVGVTGEPPETASGLFLMTLPLLIPLLFLGPLGTAISTRLIADRYMGLSTSLGGAFTAGVKLLLPLMGAIFLSGFLTLFGLLLLIIPGIILALRFALVAPATIVERKGGNAALGRSSELTKGVYGKIFCIFLYSIVLSSLLSVMLTTAFGGDSAVGLIMHYLLQAAIGAYFAAIWTVTYFERRCAVEGFDIQRLAESLGVDASEAALEEEVSGSDSEDEWE